MNYKFAQLTQSPQKKGKTITDTYIAQVDSRREELAGKLFILIEINKNDENSQKINTFLIDSIVQNFYQDEKILLREKMPSLKVEHIFETSLAKTNKQFIDFLKNKKIKIKIDDINITVGIIFNNELYLANNGKNNAFLIFPNNKHSDNSSNDNNRNNEEENNFQIINILKNKEKSAEQKKYRLFSNVISGTIPKKGSVLISNETLPEYISSKQLIDIISSLPPTGAVEQIKNTVNNINTYVSFSGIIIKNIIFEKRNEIPTIDTRESHDSIISLNKTEDNTEALLTPSGIISFKKWFKILNPNRTLKKKIKNNTTHITLKDKIHVKKKKFLSKLLAYFTSFLSNLFKILLYASKSIKTNKIKPLIVKISNQKNINTFFNIKFTKKIKNKKLLLFVSLLFILIFFFNINNAKKNKKLAEESKNYNTIAEEIKQKQNQVEASLLYGNDEGAKKLFNEINNLLQQIPPKTEKQKNQYNVFKNKFNKQLEKIRRITKADNAQEIIDLKSINSHSQAKNITYIPDTNKLYIADPSLKSIYILDLSNNTPTTVTSFNTPINQLNYPVVYKNDHKENQIFYFNTTDIISFNTINEEFFNIPIDLQGSQGIKNMAIYNSKLYTIDANKSQIYRYKKTINGFDTARAWLNKKIDLSQAIDISIDGNIYILNKDASLLKLLNGHKINFSLKACDPPLEKPSKLIVSKKLNFIYILETKNNRLVVFNKAGQFLMQYQSEKLNKLKDFDIDENKKIIYFLNDSKIFKFNAIHLK